MPLCVPLWLALILLLTAESQAQVTIRGTRLIAPPEEDVTAVDLQGAEAVVRSPTLYHSIAFPKEPNRLVTVDRDIEIWDLASRKKVDRWKLDDPANARDDSTNLSRIMSQLQSGATRSLAVSRDGQFLACLGAQLCVFHAATGKNRLERRPGCRRLPG